MMTFAKIRKSKSAIVILIAFTAVFSAYILSSLNVIKTLQLKTVDTLFSLRGPISPPDTSIVIVAIDDQAFKSLPGKWPYPNFYYGKLVENLDKAGAKLIVFDIEITEKSEDNLDDDLYFARAVTDAKNVVLAGKVVFDVGSYGTENRELLRPIAPLLRTPATWGLVNAVYDMDGFLRQYLLYYDVNSKRYYSLSVEATRRLENIKISREQDPHARFFKVGKHSIPKVSANTMLINFLGPAESIRTYSMASVLDDSTFELSGDEDTDIFEMHKKWGTFRDKIVFIGATAEELQDNKLTPFRVYKGRKRKIPGVEVHAQALSTILRDDYIYRLNGFIEFLVIILFSLVASFVTLKSRPFKAFTIVILMFFSIAGLALYLFSVFRILAILTTPILSLSLSFIVSIVYQTVTEQREKQRIRQTFKHYVAPSVVENMLNSGELPSFGGERRVLTILFSDIRRFTTFSESYEPEVVASRLSEYLTEMVDVVFKFNGTLDKFVGDELMALFGAPYSMKDHAERACLTAVEMIEKLRDIQKRWSADKKGFFQIGIGINTGKVIVGNLGSEQLFDYTVIGDEVNLGARLEGANKQYGTTIILSESTYNLVRNKAKVRELDLVRVVGKTKPIRIFELRSMNSIPQIEQDYIIGVFSEGLNFYRERRWSDALKSFRRVLRYFPTDGPSRIYTIRCLDFIENPPPLDWDGVYDFKVK